MLLNSQDHETVLWLDQVSGMPLSAREAVMSNFLDKLTIRLMREDDLDAIVDIRH